MENANELATCFFWRKQRKEANFSCTWLRLAHQSLKIELIYFEIPYRALSLALCFNLPRRCFASCHAMSCDHPSRKTKYCGFGATAVSRYAKLLLSYLIETKHRERKMRICVTSEETLFDYFSCLSLEFSARVDNLETRPPAILLLLSLLIIVIRIFNADTMACDAAINYHSIKSREEKNMLSRSRN